MGDLTFKEVAQANLIRALDLFGHEPGLKDWTPAEWTNAAAGELGELCNLTKKMRRGKMPGDHSITPDKIKEEVGGALIYLDLFCQRVGLTLADCVEYEYNRVSDNNGYSLKIGEGKP